MTYDEAGDVLDVLAEELPAEFFGGLSGGVVLRPESVPHPGLPDGRHWILGEYVRDATGRHVRVYHGSLARVLGDASREAWVSKLREVLRHELRHHVEGRAGVRDLEVEDERYLVEEMARAAATGDEIR